MTDYKVILTIDKNNRALGKWSRKWEGPFKINQLFLNITYEIEELGLDNQTLKINVKYLKTYRSILQEVSVIK